MQDPWLNCSLKKKQLCFFIIFCSFISLYERLQEHNSFNLHPVDGRGRDWENVGVTTVDVDAVDNVAEDTGTTVVVLLSVSTQESETLYNVIARFKGIQIKIVALLYYLLFALQLFAVFSLSGGNR